MITKEALQEAIAECQGTRNPDRTTCMMLAAFYTIQDHLYPQQNSGQSSATDPLLSYSFAHGSETVQIKSKSEFANAIQGRDVNEVLPIIDEAMEAVKALLPRLYNSIMDKIAR